MLIYSRSIIFSCRYHALSLLSYCHINDPCVHAFIHSPISSIYPKVFRYLPVYIFLRLAIYQSTFLYIPRSMNLYFYPSMHPPKFPSLKPKISLFSPSETNNCFTNQIFPISTKTMPSLPTSPRIKLLLRFEHRKLDCIDFFLN